MPQATAWPVITLLLHVVWKHDVDGGFAVRLMARHTEGG